MGQITTIVVPDAAATPVNRTYSPVKVNGDSAVFLEKSAVSSLGHSPLVLIQRAPVAGQTEKMYRTTLKLSIPVTYDEVINGVNRPTLGYTLRAEASFVSPAEAVLLDRKHLRKLFVGILNDPSVISMIEGQENLY